MARKAVDTSSLELFKFRFDGLLSNLVVWKDVPAHSRGVGMRCSFKIPSNLNQAFYDLTIPKTSHHCCRYDSIQFLSDSSRKEQSPSQPFLVMSLSRVSVSNRDNHGFPRVRFLCIANAGRAEAASAAAEFSRHFHTVDRSEETRNAVKML